MGIFFTEIDGRPAFYDEAVHGPRQIEKAQTARERKAGKRPEMIDNPVCAIPAGAVEITAAEHGNLLAAQSQGKSIIMRNGRPVAIDADKTDAIPGTDRVERRRARRDRLLTASDWTQLPDTLVDDPKAKSSWAEYRQALRDLDMTECDWPVSPAGRG